MKLVVLYKRMNFTVDKTAGTGTYHATYINYIIKYITGIFLIIFWYYLLLYVFGVLFGKSQNDATINQIILKTVTQGKWPSG